MMMKIIISIDIEKQKDEKIISKTTKFVKCIFDDSQVVFREIIQKFEHPVNSFIKGDLTSTLVIIYI